MDRAPHHIHSSAAISNLGSSSSGTSPVTVTSDASNAVVDGTTSPNPGSNSHHHRDILSEAELGLIWLKRRAELVRLEIQAIELDLALQQARLGELSSLLAWLQKNGTPWQDYWPNPTVNNPTVNHPTNTNATAVPTITKQRDPEVWRYPHSHQPASPSVHDQPGSIYPPTAEKDREKYFETQNIELQNIEPQTLRTPSTGALAQSPFPSTSQTLDRALATNANTATKPPQKQSNPLAQPATQTTKPAVAQPKIFSEPYPSTRKADTKSLNRDSLKTKSTPSPVQLPALDSPQTAKPRQIPSWLVSSLVHAALLLLLMLLTVPLPKQKQKLGLTGTFEPLQSSTLTLEATTPQQTNQLAEEIVNEKLTEATSLENVVRNSLPSAADISAHSLTTPDVSSIVAQPSTTGLEGVENALGGPLVDNLKTTSSLAAANFFGLQASGNIFCFVVDCSGSMRGEPLKATKLELLKTISQLKPNQRFCVFFFSQKLFPMSLESQSLEPHSLESPPLPPGMVAAENIRPVAAYATPENFVRLQHWMETVPIGNGGPPNQALKMAIELEPDSIFLLTDGVTRSDVAGYLQKTNRHEDEIEGPQVRCPIHTIGFYSKEGEGLLQRIASENGGQYRYVPNPQPPKKNK